MYCRVHVLVRRFKFEDEMYIFVDARVDGAKLSRILRARKQQFEMAAAKPEISQPVDIITGRFERLYIGMCFPGQAIQ